MPLADRLYVTHVAAEPEGDTLFPEISPAEWTEVSREPLPQSEGDTATARARRLREAPLSLRRYLANLPFRLSLHGSAALLYITAHTSRGAAEEKEQGCPGATIPAGVAGKVAAVGRGARARSSADRSRPTSKSF